ncbi:hypothetical protein G7054_g1660 [Neopestalotiopsis clavispora]|nr:hypothetical protein E8E14_002688 [Neopestalotiopsis sp. 37M]KAF7540089.1 hypothetical protein G7054_g1660 [Neopestalotiopsis clavispora]
MAGLLRRHEHEPPIGELPVPHGPAFGNEYEEYPQDTHVPPATDYEKDIFKHITQPDDSYTPEGVYWADLPFWKRWSFVNKVDQAEAKDELGTIWSMMKKDPLSPVGWYWRHAILPGAGLGLEGYVLFSIGNLEPLFKSVWPECWSSSPTVCSHNWVASITYLEVIGIMVGQVGVGIIGDWVGRRWGLIQDAFIMFLGLCILTGSWGVTLNGWIICYAWALFFYGFGVGGEYPITATSSMENAVSAGKLSTRDDRLHRGRKVTLAFMMQGWGQFVNQVMLIVLMFIFNRGYGNPPYSETATQWVFRLSFAFPALGTLWLVYYRTWKMPSAGKKLDQAKKKANVTGYDVKSMKLTFKNFGGRIFATALGWFCNDVFFYGNKLFQGQFINIVSNNPSSVMTTWTWNLVNCVVSLCGYYAASLLIDNKMYGRKMMQQVGFFMCFIMFVIPAFNYKYYTSAAGVHSFQAMYFLSSFFNQFGPNAVTFLVAGEVFPTQIRASAHGFSACIGKSGALLASVLYNYIDNQTKFYVVPWFGLAGMLVTWVWLPDTTGLDLKEQERRWQYILNDKSDEYHGIAIHPQHLSMWERWLGVGKPYHPDTDLKAKIRDIKSDWEEKQAAKEDPEQAHMVEEDEDFTDEIHSYFRGETPPANRGLKNFNKEKGEGKPEEPPTKTIPDSHEISEKTADSGASSTS